MLLALLPIGPKMTPLMSAQKEKVQVVLQETLHYVLQPLENVYQNGLELPCADGYIRQCFPRLSAWCADHMEYVSLLGLKSKSCPQCEVAAIDLGNTSMDTPDRDYYEY